MKVYKFLLNKLLFLLMLTMIVVACEEKDAGEIIGEDLTGVTKVYFDPTNSGSVSETPNIIASADGTSTITSENTIEIGVVRTGTDFSAEATVSFTATSTYTATTDFFDAGDDASGSITFSSEGSFTIPAGESRGTIVIVVTDDELATGDRAVNITLTDSSVGELGLTESNPSTTLALTVVEDDCPFIVANMTGVFDVAETRLHNNGTDSYQVTVTQSTTNPLEFRIDSIWGAPQYSLPITLVTCSKAAIYPSGTIVGQHPSFGDLFFNHRDAFFTGDPGPIFSENNKPVDVNDPASWVSYDDEKGTYTIYAWIQVGAGSFGGYEFLLSKAEE